MNPTKPDSQNAAPEEEFETEPLDADFAAPDEDIRASVAKAFAAQEEPDEEAPEESADEKAQRIRDEKGRFAAESKKPASKEAPGDGAKESPEDEGGATPEEEAAAPESSSGTPIEAPKPPQSWKPVAREAWAKVPVEVQGEVLRREQEISSVLQNTASERRLAAAFRQAVDPYMAMVQAEGSHPIQAVQRLFQTAAVLRTGSPASKAPLAAQLIRDYGIDVQSVADELDRGGQPGAQEQRQQGPVQDPRVDQLLQELRDHKAQREEAMRARHIAEVQKMSETAPYFDDLRDEIRDLIIAKAQRGIDLPLKQAYEMAVKLNPDIGALIAAKAKSNPGVKPKTAAERRAAASSLKPSRGPQVKGEGDGSIRSDIEASFRELTGS